MAARRRTTEREGAEQRRFTLLDGMIVVAAMAVGLDLIRYFDLGFDWEFHSQIWMDPRFFFHSWMIDQLVFQIFQIAIISAMIATLATLAFRLRRPRPARRRLARQPGMVAVRTVVIAWAASVPWLVLGFAGSPVSIALEGPVRSLSLVVVFAGFGVATRWGLLLLSRRWRAEPGWIDRLGRLVGIAWMVLSLGAIGLRMVC